MDYATEVAEVLNGGPPLSVAVPPPKPRHAIMRATMVPRAEHAEAAADRHPIPGEPSSVQDIGVPQLGLAPGA